MIISEASAEPTLDLWGDFSTVLRSTKSSGKIEDSTKQFTTLTLGASSYIWRPWFAVYSGTLGLTTDKTDYDDSPGSKSSYLAGNLNLSIFPSSRFSGLLYLEKNDSDNELQGIDFNSITSRYGYRQHYREPAGKYLFDFSVEHNERQSDADGDDDGDRARFDYTHTWDSNRLQVSTQAHKQENKFQDTKASDRNIIVRHTLTRSGGLAIETLGSIVEVDDQSRSTKRELKARQLSSFGTWQSDKIKGLLVFGSARFSSLENSQGNISVFNRSRLDTISGNISANYAISDNVTLKGGSSIIDTTNDSGGTKFNSRSISVNYRPIDRPFRNFRYNRGISSSIVDRSTDGESEQRYIVRYSHGLNGNFAADNSNLFLGFNQAFATSHSTNEEKRNEITHSINGNWKFGESNNISLLRLIFSDARFFGQDESSFQLLNIQYTRDRAISRDSALTGNLTLQASRQERSGVTSVDVLANGIIGYRRRYLFNLPHLSMNLDLELASHGLTPSRFSSVRRDNAVEDQGRFRTQFVYSIGKMDLFLTTLVIYLDGDLEKIVQFQLNRRLGAR